MEHALAELPLAIFTTLAPMSAGAFIVIAFAVNFISFTDEQLKKLDRFTLIPFVLSVIGIFASVLHLTQPLNAIYIYNGLLSSPLVNEIAIAGVFAALAFVYCLLGFINKLSLKLRKILSAIVAVFALFFAVMVGLAYIMDTILSWYNPFTIAMFVGFCLLGGALLGSMTLSLSGVFTECLENKKFKNLLLATAVIGAVVAIGSMVGYAVYVNGLYTPAHSGAEMLSEVIFMLVIFFVLALVAFAGQLFLIFKGNNTVVAVVSVVVMFAAIFCARMVFYATQFSVGL